jgi:hypothetical protein
MRHGLHCIARFYTRAHRPGWRPWQNIFLPKIFLLSSNHAGQAPGPRMRSAICFRKTDSWRGTYPRGLPLAFARLASRPLIPLILLILSISAFPPGKYHNTPLLWRSAHHKPPRRSYLRQPRRVSYHPGERYPPVLWTSSRPEGINAPSLRRFMVAGTPKACNECSQCNELHDCTVACNGCKELQRRPTWAEGAWPSQNIFCPRSFCLLA